MSAKGVIIGQEIIDHQFVSIGVIITDGRVFYTRIPIVVRLAVTV